MEQDSANPEPGRRPTRAKSSTRKTVAKDNKAKTDAVRIEATRQRQIDEVTGRTIPDLSEAPPGNVAQPGVVQKIRECAYWLFVSGGYQHGHDIQHWLEAERQVLDSAKWESDGEST